MNLLTIFTRFPDHESCVEHLERIRYREGAYCPHCGSTDVARKADGHRKGRWNCHDCKSSFNVLSGTIFQKTKIPLQKWFAAIGLIVNAKKSLSSYQLGRDLNVNQKSAWYMQQRIRAEMATKEGTRLIHGIIEADETYIGGKPRGRKGNNKRGRGTNKTAVLGAVERGGIVAAKVTDSVSGRAILAFIKDNVDTDAALLISDEFTTYRKVGSAVGHAVIRHSRHYAEGQIHTNTIKGYWALLKRAWYGSHRHYSKQFTPQHVAEQSWKYNQRKNKKASSTFLEGCFA